jgi:enediyne biosynthesis protein E4
MMKWNRFILICLLPAAWACGNKKGYTPPKDPLFTALSAKETGISFTNRVQDDSMMNVFNYRNFYNGGGVAIGDINNDGRADVFMTANQGKNRLFLNKGNLRFEDITETAGIGGTKAWSTGVCMADVNADGLLDIYVCNSGNVEGDKRENELFINNGNNTFTEKSAAYNLNDPGGFHTHGVFFDYDKDGDLDCYLLNNSYYPIDKIANRDIRHIRDERGGDKLMRNDGNRFTDVSEQAGIYGSLIGFGLGVNVGDVNADGWPDLYISNDFFEKDYLYINNRNGTFREAIDEQMAHISQSSMGADMADINNDSRPDIFCTDMLPESDYRLKTTTKFDDYDFFNAKVRGSFHFQYLHNDLQLNNGDGTFSEIAPLAGVHATDWSWGALMFDFNNDGWKDIFVSNGIYRDLTDQDYIDFLGNPAVRQQVANAGKFDLKAFLDKLPSTPIPNYGFVNQKNLLFSNDSYNLGLAQPSFSNGAAYGDLDNDGDQDLVVNNVNMECFVYRNNAEKQTGNRYLRVQLQGDSINPFGVGADVTIHYGVNQQNIQAFPARGFESCVDPVLCFGTEKTTVIDSVVIVWPDFKKQVLQNVATNQLLKLKHTDATLIFNPQQPSVKAMYANITSTVLSGDFEHKENAFVDFDKERLIPKMLSTEGPKLATGDVNGDGLEDLYMGNAKEDTAKLFLQTTDGKFVPTKQAAFERDKDYETVGVEFFDADGDKDLDLIAASGGNEDLAGAYQLAPRLYLNDGKGNFTRGFDNITGITLNASCVRVNDVDGDGDADLFIGGRSIPGKYGLSPNSYILFNDGKGFFKDMTATAAPELQQYGMITDAQWTDTDKDGKKELVVVGDWMPLTIFKNENGRLKKKTELANTSGWWNVLVVADIDKDGDDDLLAGNTGLNSKLKADAAHPAQLYVNDFDKNGQTECIPTYYKTDGKSYPMYLRGEMVMQMPALKKKFLRYAEYAGKGIEDVFSKEQIKNAVVRKAEQTQTCLFINDGKGNFTQQALPLMAQIAPVFGIYVNDLDGDGNNDLFLAGNFYEVKPEIGRYDASYGITLLGDGKNNFRFQPCTASGLFLKGEVRDVKTITTGAKQTYIFVARNNENLQVFRK